MDNITGLIVTAIVATVGIIKFRLIEELIKKMTSNDQKAKGIAVVFLFVVVVVLTVISLSLDAPRESYQADGAADDKEIVTEEIVEEENAVKTELEVKVDAVKEGIALTEKLVSQAKENKRIKDSTFIANRKERWAYQIGDWTNDDGKILEMHAKLSTAENIKVVRQKRKYLLIKEDFGSSDELQASLEQLRQELQGLSVNIIDLNGLLTRRDDNFVVKNQTFRKKRKKIELECLEAN
jgi:hypothetical protein